MTKPPKPTLLNSNKDDPLYTQINKILVLLNSNHSPFCSTEETFIIFVVFDQVETGNPAHNVKIKGENNNKWMECSVNASRRWKTNNCQSISQASEDTKAPKLHPWQL